MPTPGSEWFMLNGATYTGLRVKKTCGVAPRLVNSNKIALPVPFPNPKEGNDAVQLLLILSNFVTDFDVEGWAFNLNKCLITDKTVGGSRNAHLLNDLGISVRLVSPHTTGMPAEIAGFMDPSNPCHLASTSYAWYCARRPTGDKIDKISLAHARRTPGSVGERPYTHIDSETLHGSVDEMLADKRDLVVRCAMRVVQDRDGQLTIHLNGLLNAAFHHEAVRRSIDSPLMDSTLLNVDTTKPLTIDEALKVMQANTPFSNRHNNRTLPYHLRW